MIHHYFTYANDMNFEEGGDYAVQLMKSMNVDGIFINTDLVAMVP
jgi:hypothetical protein